MQQMNADDGLNKVQLTLYTSRWQAAIPRERSLHPCAPRIPAPAPRLQECCCRSLPLRRDRRYTRVNEQKLAETSACCAVS